MAFEPIDEAKAASLQDLGIEVAPIVDDDEHGRAVREPFGAASEDGGDAGHIALDRATTRPSGGSTELSLAAIVQFEDLVRVAMLLVVVDESRDRAAT